VGVLERERLIARIRQIRRLAAPVDRPNRPSADRPTGTSTARPTDTPDPDPAQDALRALEVRVMHLEQLVQGLQDSVHRESSRQSRRIAEIEAAIQPAALGRTLSEDARERGL
jgi:hypothetical protein